jgi:hypothetical protein
MTSFQLDEVNAMFGTINVNVPSDAITSMHDHDDYCNVLLLLHTFSWCKHGFDFVVGRFFQRNRHPTPHQQPNYNTTTTNQQTNNNNNNNSNNTLHSLAGNILRLEENGDLLTGGPTGHAVRIVDLEVGRRFYVVCVCICHKERERERKVTFGLEHDFVFDVVIRAEIDLDRNTSDA